MREEIYRNYQCFDSKGRRIAIFGVENNRELELFELYCAKNDQFSKFTANWVRSCFSDGLFAMKQGEEFNPLEWHPIIHRIKIKKGDSAKYTFDQYCKNNFYRKTLTIFKYVVETLTKDNEIIALKGGKRSLYNHFNG